MFSHLSLGLPCGLFRSGFPTKIYIGLISPMRATCPAQLILLDLIEFHGAESVLLEKLIIVKK
jgi:hypothetical protein